MLGSSLGTNSFVGLANADYSFLGEQADNLAGTSNGATGDINGDGRNDVIIGASGNTYNGSSAGKVYLIFSGL